MKRFAFIISLLPFIFLGLWLVAIPESLLKDLIAGSFNNSNVYLETEGFKKGLFYNFSIQKIFLKKKGDVISGEALAVFESVDGRLNIMSILKLRPELDFDCIMNHGEVSGAVQLMHNSNLKIKGSRIHTRGIPFLELLGIRGDGNLALSLWLNDGKGEIKFSVDEMDFQSTSLGVVYLPLDVFRKMRGLMLLENETLDIKSLALEGKGIYARVKGSIKEGMANLAMELMPDSSFESGNLFRIMLEKYRVSPGFYLIPIRSSLFNEST